MTEKRAKKVSIMSIMMICILFLVVGLTIAKYITTGSKAGSMQYAKWNVTITESDLDNTKYTSEPLKADRIAPGTEGTFKIKIDATGTETGVKYDIDFTNIENKPANMYFVVGDTRYNSFDELATGISGVINANDSNKVVESTVKWVWDYETGSTEEEKNSNDLIDTNEGIAGGTMTFNANVTATQVQPAK